MPILQNAKKALRSSQKKAVYNQKVKSKVKNMIDKMKKEPSVEALNNVFSAIDKAVKRNIFHKNKAARLKSQMSKLLKVEAKITKKTTAKTKKVAKTTKKTSQNAAKKKTTTKKK